MKAMKTMNACQAVALISVLASASLASPTETPAVRAWTEQVVIPTYPVGEPETNPYFYHGRKYQGAKGPVYPYAMLSAMSDVKQDREYQAVYLENEYVKISVLPEMGGRLFTATDKTNGYEFFYRQHVIKPALIGMAGAWISGGIEWCIPHHHRVSTYMTVDHRIVENPDGSKTIWVGETELRHRMKWLVGLTLYPSRSYVEVTVKLLNRTPFAHSMLYWANAAVHAGPEYQMIFSPQTRLGTYHAKWEFVHWPIGQETYHGLDRNGVDLSWWKNHPASISIFAYDDKADFFGGYDHAKKAGTMHVGDHHVMPGKKFFLWGSGAEGKAWDRVLTDEDGPYIELMAGGYSDNQPDYSWVQPHEPKIFRDFWYPIRELGSAKHANREAAVNLEVTDSGQTKLAVNTTAPQPDVRVVLQANGRSVFDRRVSVAPDKPFSAEVSLPVGMKEDQLRLAVVKPSGEELISYQPQHVAEPTVPEPVAPTPAPETIKTVEELYLTGLRLEQLNNGARDPRDYYREALKRDSGHSATNVALGIDACKRGLFKEAEKRFRTALERVTPDYTRPKNGEAYYYLAVALRGQGREAEAAVALNKATWSHGWHAVSHYTLAELACRKGDYAQTLKQIDQSLTTNASDCRSHTLRAILLRKLGRNQEALVAIEKARALDPLDFWAENEALVHASKQNQTAANAAETAMKQMMRGEVQSYLEVATDYGDCGLWDEAIDVLTRYVATVPKQKHVHPMACYYLGQYSIQKGDTEGAARYDQLAAEMSPDGCFPFRLESIGVLEQAIDRNPSDARALYYLGNVLYDLQPQRAIAAWEQAAKLDPAFATVHRNLAIAYHYQQRDDAKAVTAMQRAVECDGDDPLFYVELDMFQEKAGTPLKKRLAVLEANHDVVVQRMDALLRQVDLHIAVGQFDRAIDLLAKHHYRRWEGEFLVHQLYVTAHLCRGEKFYRAGKYETALADFEAALAYPENFDAAQPHAGPPRAAEIHYWHAAAYEALSREDAARRHLQMAAKADVRVTEQRYWRGLARAKLEEHDEAARDFDTLIRCENDWIEQIDKKEFFSSFGVNTPQSERVAEGKYLAALGHLGKGNTAKAGELLREALGTFPDHAAARRVLANLPERL